MRFIKIDEKAKINKEIPLDKVFNLSAEEKKMIVYLRALMKVLTLPNVIALMEKEVVVLLKKKLNSRIIMKNILFMICGNVFQKKW